MVIERTFAGNSSAKGSFGKDIVFGVKKRNFMFILYLQANETECKVQNETR